MTEKELRQKVVEIAQGWHGCNEADGTHKPIIDLYNTLRPLPVGYAVKYNDEWCATFCSAVAIKAGLTDIMLPECSVGRMIDLYKKAGRWVENDAHVPQPADMIAYDWKDNGRGDNTTGRSHIGIVVEVNNGKIKVIEGNMDSAVGYRTIDVDGRYIRGYYCPDYASKAKEAKSSKRFATVADVPATLRTETAELIAAGALTGKGGSMGLDLTEDMLRCIIIAKRYADSLCNQQKA